MPQNMTALLLVSSAPRPARMSRRSAPLRPAMPAIMFQAGMESLLVQVHFPVGLVDLLVNIAVPVTPGNTAGDGDMLFLHGPERVTDTGMEVLPAGFAVDDDELVTTCAVDLFAKGPEETVCCTANEGISGLMSLEVIDLLQAVQIEVGDAQAAAILPGQRLTDLVVPVSVIESGRKILHVHLGDDVVLLGDLPFLELDLLLEIFAGLDSHFFRKTCVTRLHFAIGIGKVEMAAAGALRCPAENSGDALACAQADAGIRRGGDPEPARADEHFRHGPDDVILLFADLAPGHPACEGSERPDDGGRIGGILMFPGTEPAEHIIKAGEQELRIVLAIVPVQEKTCQFYDLPFLRIICQRGMLHLCPPCAAIPEAAPLRSRPLFPGPAPPKTTQDRGRSAICARAREAARSGFWHCAGWSRQASNAPSVCYPLSPRKARALCLLQGPEAAWLLRACGPSALFAAPHPSFVSGCPVSAR